MAKKVKPKKKPAGEKPLNDRQKKFCDEFLLSGNKLEAAIKAGYSKSTAHKQAQLYIGKDRNSSRFPMMWDYVEARRKKIADKYEITQERVMAELGKILFTDVRELYDENGNPVPVHLLSDGAAALIAGVEVEEEKTVEGKKAKTSTHTKKYKLLKKTEAITIANKMMGFNKPEKVEHEAGPSFLDFLKATSSAGNAGDSK